MSEQELTRKEDVKEVLLKLRIAHFKAYQKWRKREMSRLNRKKPKIVKKDRAWMVLKHEE